MGDPNARPIRGTVTVCGTEYQLRSRTLQCYSELVAHIATRRDNPIQVVADSTWNNSNALTIAMNAAAEAVAKRSAVVGGSEFDEFLESIEGVAFAFWVAVRTDHKEVSSLEKAQDLIVSDLDKNGVHRLRVIKSILDGHSGEAEAKNSDSPQGRGDSESSESVGVAASRE